ncbi:phosphatase PAP2 family protein [Psychromonas aquimarina]|uniref:phosphatase PAP2 family protein n=1 Tax=Psychromonas aquimarina TaxID=444919 RepID=UPI0003FAA051|nr:phosphatase PAP2 family protein [Psychromonas aquimarina]
MNKFFTIGLLTSVIFPSAAFSANNIEYSVNDSIVEAGDMVQILVPVTGLFAAWMHDDMEGAKQLTYSTFSTQLIIHGTKNTVGRKRPNGSSWNSFPSGHTGAAFSGAAFLQSRYGSEWGIPAYAAASFVGASRIYGNYHFAGDVTAAAGIAFLMNQYFVSPYRMEGVYFNAQPTNDGFALGVTVMNNAFDKKESRKVNKLRRTPIKHRLELGIGANLTDSAAESGVDQYLYDAQLVDKLQPFAYVNYQYALENNNEFELEFNPNETRRSGIVSEDFEFDGQSFSRGQEVFSAFRHWMLGSNLYKGLQVTDNLEINVGLGMYVHMFGFDASKEGSTETASDQYWRAMPSGTLKGKYSITPALSTLAKVQCQFWENDSYLAAEAGINYQINREWDMGLKYAYSKTTLENSQAKSSYSGNAVILTFANHF